MGNSKRIASKCGLKFLLFPSKKTTCKMNWSVHSKMLHVAFFLPHECYKISLVTKHGYFLCTSDISMWNNHLSGFLSQAVTVTMTEC